MSCTEFQNNFDLKVHTLHLQFFCSCLNESFNRCSSRWLSGSEVSKSLSKLTQKFLKVVEKWWWVQIIPIFFPLEKWGTDFICIRDFYKTLVLPWPRTASLFSSIRRLDNYLPHDIFLQVCAIGVRNIREEVTEMIDQCTVLVEKIEQVREN